MLNLELGRAMALTILCLYLLSRYCGAVPCSEARPERFGAHDTAIHLRHSLVGLLGGREGHKAFAAAALCHYLVLNAENSFLKM